MLISAYKIDKISQMREQLIDQLSVLRHVYSTTYWTSLLRFTISIQKKPQHISNWSPKSCTKSCVLHTYMPQSQSYRLKQWMTLNSFLSFSPRCNLSGSFATFISQIYHQSIMFLPTSIPMTVFQRTSSVKWITEESPSGFSTSLPHLTTKNLLSTTKILSMT